VKDGFQLLAISFQLVCADRRSIEKVKSFPVDFSMGFLSRMPETGALI
jgi:hypothetical protein